MKFIPAYPLVLLLLFCAHVDPALANKFETISGGVNGLDREKIELLKTVSRYSGLFLFFLALLSWITRHRFEGFIGCSRGGGYDTVLKNIVLLTTSASVLIGLSLL